MCLTAPDLTKPFRQSFALPPPLPTEVEAWVCAETKEKAPFLLTNVNTEGSCHALCVTEGYFLTSAVRCLISNHVTKKLTFKTGKLFLF